MGAAEGVNQSEYEILGIVNKSVRPIYWSVVRPVQEPRNPGSTVILLSNNTVPSRASWERLRRALSSLCLQKGFKTLIHNEEFEMKLELARSSLFDSKTSYPKETTALPSFKVNLSSFTGAQNE